MTVPATLLLIRNLCTHRSPQLDRPRIAKRAPDDNNSGAAFGFNDPKAVAFTRMLIADDGYLDDDDDDADDAAKWPDVEFSGSSVYYRQLIDAERLSFGQVLVLRK